MIFSSEVYKSIVFANCLFLTGEGARPTTRDVGYFDFWAVHVVTQMVPHPAR